MFTQNILTNQYHYTNFDGQVLIVTKESEVTIKIQSHQTIIRLLIRKSNNTTIILGSSFLEMVQPYYIT